MSADGPIRESHVAVDFETYYDSEYSLSKINVFQYVNDERFEPYLVSIYTPSFQWVGPPQEFDWGLLDGKKLLAHNAMFDSCVYDRMVQLGTIRPAKHVGWVDTADLAAYLLCKRSLQAAVKELLGVTISKVARVKMLGKHFWQLSAEDKKELLDYAGGDSLWCYRLWERFHSKWPDHEQRISELSREEGKRGMRIDKPALETALSVVANHLFTVERAIPWDFRGEGYKTPFAPTLIRAACQKAKIEFPMSTAKTDETFLAWVADNKEKAPWVAVLNDWRSINSLQAKLRTIETTLLPNGRFPFALKYFGAHTGRWSGDEGFNMQNLYKETLFDVDLRGLFLPDEDCVLMVADQSGIEPRLLWWQVGDEKMLDLLRKGWNQYHAHAVSTMGWPAVKDLKALYEAGDKEAAGVYPLAKARTLGLGYGCGSGKFFKLANQWGIPLTEEGAKQAVTEYRASNPLIVGFWKARHYGAVASAANRDPEYRIRMASGRDMVYFQPHFKMEKQDDGSERSEVRAKDWMGDNDRRLYGGKITENIIQALGRDVLVDGWVKTDKEFSGDVRVHFTAHDEFVASATRAAAPELQKAWRACLERSPEWAPDLPLVCKPKIAERYFK